MSHYQNWAVPQIFEEPKNVSHNGKILRAAYLKWRGLLWDDSKIASKDEQNIFYLKGLRILQTHFVHLDIILYHINLLISMVSIISTSTSTLVLISSFIIFYNIVTL